MRMLLAISGLMVMWICCGTSSAQPKGSQLGKGALPHSATGHGETVDAAKKAALSKAVAEVADLMALNQLKSFKITEEYVRKHLLVDTGNQGKDFAVENIAEPFKAWVLNFRTDTDWWKDIARHDQDAERKLRGEYRQMQGSRTIITLGLLLFAGFGYVRLDEFTHRRYTAWLRLAGLSVATTIVAGWLWVFSQAPG